MKLGTPVADFMRPPHPKGITLNGTYIRLEPLDAIQHGPALFAANAHDHDGANWTYLPYGPFDDYQAYEAWLAACASESDPVFFALVRQDDHKAVGVASYLRINQADASIEVGHIHYSPLLQRSLAGTEAMALMMGWAFENGYRRYEWKCNALNIKSRKAAARLGLSYEGVFRQMSVQKGRNRDTAWFAAIDSEWPAIKTCFATYLNKDNLASDGTPLSSLTEMTAPLLYRTDNFDFS